MGMTTFSGPVRSTNGFVGNVTGDVTGNVTGNVTGVTIGSVTTKSGAGAIPITASAVKLTTTGGLSYSIDDMEAFRNITQDWDANLVPLKTKTEADEAGFKYIRRERPDLWTKLANVVTVKPRKTSVKVSV